MPLLTISAHQRQAEIDRAAREEAWHRRYRRELLALLLACVGWNLVGLTIIGLAMASSNREQAEGWVAVGVLVGYTGMGLTLLWHFVQMAERGDI